MKTYYLLALTLFVALVASLSFTAPPAKAATLVVDVYASITPMTPEGVRDGIYSSDLTIFSPASTVYFGLSIKMSDLTPFTLGDGIPETTSDLNFTVFRTDFTDVGPINFSGAVLPGTSPQFGAWNSFGVSINLNGQVLDGSVMNQFTSTNTIVNPASLDILADIARYTANVKVHQGPTVSTGTAAGKATLAPEPGSLLLLMFIALVGISLLRPRATSW